MRLHNYHHRPPPNIYRATDIGGDGSLQSNSARLPATFTMSTFHLEEGRSTLHCSMRGFHLSLPTAVFSPKSDLCANLNHFLRKLPRRGLVILFSDNTLSKLPPAARSPRVSRPSPLPISRRSGLTYVVYL